LALGALVNIQLNPKFVEVKILVSPAATNRLPSAEEDTDCQYTAGSLLVRHVAPAFVEVALTPEG